MSLISESDFPIPETKVLAIASHVVYGYVGNKMATLVMQALGCDVSALNTVNFSNHTAYKQFRGTKVPREEIDDLYAGLQESELADFDMMLTGYAASAGAVEAVGSIARDLRFRVSMKPGSFFWILDPVMGDNGALYVDRAVVPVYRSLLGQADMIVPNQFELETLAEIPDEHDEREGQGGILGMATVQTAIEKIHREHRTPHVVVTSIKTDDQTKIAVVGSTRTSEGKARSFKISIPNLEVFFSGTGDLFASLMLVRFREAALEAGLTETTSWTSPDDVEPTDLPLARAAEKVLSSMHTVLEKTAEHHEKVAKSLQPREEGDRPGVELGEDKRKHRTLTKAAEVRVIRNVGDLKRPRPLFKAEALNVGTLPQMRESP